MSPSGNKEDSEALARPGDPFDKHLHFIKQFDRRHQVTSSAKWMIEPICTLDTKAGQLVAGSIVDALLKFESVVKSPRTKTEGELDAETEEAMSHREPQFHLRNIGRAERYADPEAPLEVVRERPEYGLSMFVDEPDRNIRHESPIFIEELTVDALAANVGYMRWFRDEMKWEEHFSRELKDAATGPMWRRTPTVNAQDHRRASDTSMESDDEA